MKLTIEQKKRIYELYQTGMGYRQLSNEFNTTLSHIKHICKLIDKHGLESIHHKYRTYSILEKEAAILYMKHLRCHVKNYRTVLKML